MELSLDKSARKSMVVGDRFFSLGD
ncbi:hypothetical protein SOVF_037990, partial [Spinacia oleracea]